MRKLRLSGLSQSCRVSKPGFKFEHLWLQLPGFSHHPTLPRSICKNPQLAPLPTPSPQFPPELRDDIDSSSIEVRRCLSHPAVNAESLLNGKLQGVRAGSPLAFQENWLGCAHRAKAGSFFRDLTLQHSSRAPESSLCHQIKFGNFNKDVPKETVN